MMDKYNYVRMRINSDKCERILTVAQNGGCYGIKDNLYSWGWNRT